MQHSNVVGGSTAKRVINCPASVRLALATPPKTGGRDADTGSLLHNVIAAHLDSGKPLSHFLGVSFGDIKLTPRHIEDKLVPALESFDEFLDGLTYKTESRVGFGDLLPGVFGSTDIVGRYTGTDKALVLDWKFGDGVLVDAVENEQLMFYAAAALRTEELAPLLAGVTQFELVIIQPPAVRRWTTTLERIQQFESQLVMAVNEAQRPDARLVSGEHCRWCPAKVDCPEINGMVARSLRKAVGLMNAEQIGRALKQAALLDDWIKELRERALTIAEEGVSVPGYKVVPKRATRAWSDEKDAVRALTALGLNESDLYATELKSPAQVERLLKRQKQTLPDNLVLSVSSGNTLAPEDDPRAPALLIGKHLAALSKL